MSLRPALLGAVVCAVLAPLARSQDHPFHLAVVPNLDSADLSVLDMRAHRELARVPIGTRPQLVAMGPDGRYAYVQWGPIGAGVNLSMVDLATWSVVRTTTLPAGSSISELEISPDGGTLAVGGSRRGSLFLLDPLTLHLRRQPLDLCRACGTTVPVLSGATVTFSSDSTYLFAAVPGENALVTLRLPSGDEVARTPILAPGDSSAFLDIQTFPGLPELTFAAKYGVHANLTLWPGHLELDARASAPMDVLPLRFGGELVLAYGSINYPYTGANRMRLRHLNSGATLDLPGLPSTRWLRFDPTRFELWGTCASFDPVCGTYKIDVFHLLTLQRTTITGLADVRAGLPAFTADYRYYYQPIHSWNVIEVIDAATKLRHTVIPVGGNPRGVFLQGDARTRHVYT